MKIGTAQANYGSLKDDQIVVVDSIVSYKEGERRIGDRVQLISSAHARLKGG